MLIQVLLFMKVKLFFMTSYDKEIEKKIKNFDIIRLKTFIQFKTKEGWSEPFDAIIDTGAPTSLIPMYIWNQVEHDTIAEHNIHGISRKPECAIPIKIGRVSCILIDEEGNKTEELNIHSYLVLSNEVPLILGFKDLLSKFSTSFNYQKQEAYIIQQ